MSAPVHQSCDSVVIGGGPGGFAAAIYLARFNRRVLLFDGGRPRASWSPWNRNYPGFPEGISGVEMLERFRAQACEFNVRVIPERVTELTRRSPAFCVTAGGQGYETRGVILATGVRDRWPDVPNVEELAGRQIRVCPICDAYEANGQRIGLYGAGDRVAREALYLREFTDDVLLFTGGMLETQPVKPGLLERIRAEGVRRFDAPLVRLEPVAAKGEAVRVVLADGREVEVDRFFSALGCGVNSELALRLGAEADEDGYLVTDRKQQTTVPGLFAVGDVTTAINQVTVAVGQAAVAATSLHNSLLDF